MEKPIQTNKGTGQKEEQSAGLDQAMVKWTSAVAVFTGLLFLANAIGLFFIEEQWRIANRSQADLREQLRAVVSYDGITVIPANIKDGKPTAYAFITKFHNFGATRTYEFKAWVSVHYFDESVPNSQDFTKPWDKVDVNNAIVGPGADIFMAPLTVNPDYAAKAMNKEGIIIIWGHADWADIFQTDQIHPVSFCVLAIPSIGPNGNFVFAPAPFRADCNSSS